MNSLCYPTKANGKITKEEVVEAYKQLFLKKEKYRIVHAVTVEFRGGNVLYHIVFASRSPSSDRWLGNFRSYLDNVLPRGYERIKSKFMGVVRKGLLKWTREFITLLTMFITQLITESIMLPPAPSCCGDVVFGCLGGFVVIVCSIGSCVAVVNAVVGEGVVAVFAVAVVVVVSNGGVSDRPAHLNVAYAVGELAHAPPKCTEANTSSTVSSCGSSPSHSISC